MKRREWSERRLLKKQRARSGYTSARLTKLTAERARALLKKLSWADAVGLDELIYLLVEAEAARRKIDIG